MIRNPFNKIIIYYDNKSLQLWFQICFQYIDEDLSWQLGYLSIFTAQWETHLKSPNDVTFIRRLFPAKQFEANNNAVCVLSSVRLTFISFPLTNENAKLIISPLWSLEEICP